MTDRGDALLEAFLRGEQTLAQLREALAQWLGADPGAAASLRARLEALYGDGRLPVQVYTALSGIVAPDSAARSHGPANASDASGVEATRLRPAAEAAAEATRLKVASTPEPTRHKAAPTAEPTIAPPGRAEVGELGLTGGDLTGGGRTGGGLTGGGDTGSDWAHPDEWESRSEAPIGPGSVIKQRFVLESILGQGGMGVVYRALDRRKEEARDRDPHVAIKILSEEFRRHPQSLIALQREARKAQTLAHPNIITVHDFDRDGTTVYMTMELLDGAPLNRVIGDRLGGMPSEKALPVILGMAEAMAYAHRKGIVHSDFKPANVFLTRKGDVKVLDFGIARAVPNELQPDADRTVFDATELGALTPSYASPEMLEGEVPVPADDVFALGVVAHELLTGQHPFGRLPADAARRQGLAPPPISGLPRRRRRTLAKAMAFERAARQPDAGAFLRELQGASPLRKTAYAATLLALAGFAAYSMYAGTQLRPDVPFEELAPQQQQAFNAAVAQGQQALEFGDIALDDAFEYFARAYGIHRNNADAVRGLRTVADRFLESMEGADPGLQRNVLRKLQCHEHLATYRPLASACREMLGAGQCTPAALGCPRAPSE